jgi:hypothetical protein
MFVTCARHARCGEQQARQRTTVNEDPVVPCRVPVSERSSGEPGAAAWRTGRCTSSAPSDPPPSRSAFGALWRVERVDAGGGTTHATGSFSASRARWLPRQSVPVPPAHRLLDPLPPRQIRSGTPSAVNNNAKNEARTPHQPDPQGRRASCFQTLSGGRDVGGGERAGLAAGGGDHPVEEPVPPSPASGRSTARSPRSVTSRTCSSAWTRPSRRRPRAPLPRQSVAAPAPWESRVTDRA